MFFVFPSSGTDECAGLQQAVPSWSVLRIHKAEGARDEKCRVDSRMHFTKASD